MNPPARTPTVFASALRIFDLSLGQMLWSRRSIFLALAVGGPIVLAFAVRAIVLWTPAGMPLGAAVQLAPRSVLLNTRPFVPA